MTQLSLFGVSENQDSFMSMDWGLLTFYPAKTNKVKDTCQKCLLRDGVECQQAPCSDFQRFDKQEGYFSIHDFPDGTQH